MFTGQKNAAHRAAFFMGWESVLGDGVFRQDRVGQLHVGGLQAWIVGTNFLHRRFQVGATNTAITGNEATGIVLGSDDQLVILEGQVGGSGGRAG
jgi:hypothetical protein